MLKIWGRTNSVNVQKVMWCVGELGLAHERYDAGLEHGVNSDAWYLAKNPNGRIPLIDYDGFWLWESNTIVRYLAARHGSDGLYPAALEQRADAERWMDWQLSRLAGPLGTVFQQLVRTPEAQRDLRAVEAGTREINQAWLVLDQHLASQPFVTGARFSMGDIPVGALAHRWLNLSQVEKPALPHVTRWYRALCERPAYRAHVMLPLS
jgi:glutathione S-transferase